MKVSSSQAIEWAVFYAAEPVPVKSSRAGHVARTVVPAPLEEVMLNVPPASLARSFIEESPSPPRETAVLLLH